MKDNLKPDERAQSLLNNGLYFGGSKTMAKELALFICETVMDQRLKIDDFIYWKLVKEEIYKL